MATTAEYIVQATPTTLLSTELGNGTGLAANTFSAAGAAVNNVQATSNLNGYTNAYLELVLSAPSAAFAANTAIYLWFLKSIDGTNYEDTSANPRPPDVIIPVEANGSAQRITMDIKLPPGQWKPIAENVPGSGTQALGASGNTIKILPYTYQGV